MAGPSRPSDRGRGDGRRGAEPRRRPGGGASGPIRRAPQKPDAGRRVEPEELRSAPGRRSPQPPRRRDEQAGAAARRRHPAPGTTAHPEAHRLTTRTDTSDTVLGPRTYTPRRIGLLAVIALVLLVTVSFPLRNHYQYKAEQREVAQERVALEHEIADLEREQQQLQDPAYIEQQARIRFGAVKPGETPYRVSQEDPAAKAAREKAEAELAAKPWQTRVWDSISQPQDPVVPQRLGE